VPPGADRPPLATPLFSAGSRILPATCACQPAPHRTSTSTQHYYFLLIQSLLKSLPARPTSHLVYVWVTPSCGTMQRNSFKMSSCSRKTEPGPTENCGDLPISQEALFSDNQGRNEVRWRQGQEAILGLPCSNLRSFGSKCTALKKLLDIVGAFRQPHID